MARLARGEYLDPLTIQIVHTVPSEFPPMRRCSTVDFGCQLVSSGSSKLN